MTRVELQILAVFLCILVILRNVGDIWSPEDDGMVPSVVIIAMVGMITCVVRPDRTVRRSADRARAQARAEDDRSPSGPRI